MTEIKVVVHSVHFHADQKLVDFVKNKANKLSKLYENIIECEVFLKVDNVSEIENKVSEIKLFIPGSDLFAKKTAKTFEEATDMAVDALRRQLKKRKQKVWGV